MVKSVFFKKKKGKIDPKTFTCNYDTYLIYRKFDIDDKSIRSFDVQGPKRI